VCYDPRIDIDLGDANLSINLRVKGLPRYRLAWHPGVPRPTRPEDRVVKPPPYAATTGRIDVIMDLAADMKVPLSVQFTDEVGNPVDTPDGTTTTYTVDDPTLINLTDNGDGTAEAAAVGPLGTANVHVDVSWNGSTVTGDLQIVVVAGLAERVTIVAGDPTEVTPDEGAPTPTP
jgi:hypothetical protein